MRTRSRAVPPLPDSAFFLAYGDATDAASATRNYVERIPRGRTSYSEIADFQTNSGSRLVSLRETKSALPGADVDATYRTTR